MKSQNSNQRSLRSVSISLVVTGFLICHSQLHAKQNQGEDSLQRLVDALESDNQFIRHTALIDLEKLGEKAAPAIEKLCVGLKTDNFADRSDIADALVSIGQPAVEPVKALLNDESSVVRAAALQILGRLNAVSIKQAAGMETDADPRVRAGLAISLKRANSIEAIQILKRLLFDAEPAVAAQAIISLAGLSYDCAKSL